MDTTKTYTAFDLFTGKVNPKDLSFPELLHLYEQITPYVPTLGTTERTEVLEEMCRKAKSFSELIAYANRSCMDSVPILRRAFKKVTTPLDLIEIFRVRNAPEDRKLPNALHLEILQQLFSRGVDLFRLRTHADKSMSDDSPLESFFRIIQRIFIRGNVLFRTRKCFLPGIDDGFLELFFCAVKARTCVSLAPAEVLEIEREAKRLLRDFGTNNLWEEIFSVQSEHECAKWYIVRQAGARGALLLELFLSPEAKVLCIDLVKEIEIQNHRRKKIAA